MKLEIVGNYLFVDIEQSDWRQGRAREIIEKIKSTPGRVYYPDKKNWRIHKMFRSVLNNYLPVFTDEEELQGEIELKEFMSQFDDDTSYSL